MYCPSHPAFPGCTPGCAMPWSVCVTFPCNHQPAEPEDRGVQSLCREQGARKTPTERLVPGQPGQCSVWCLFCTHGLTHPLQAMSAGAPAHPSRNSLTPILHSSLGSVRARV